MFLMCDFLKKQLSHYSGVDRIVFSFEYFSPKGMLKYLRERKELKG